MYYCTLISASPTLARDLANAAQAGNWEAFQAL